MQEAGFTPEEFGKLQEAEDNSNALVTTETIAMHAVKGEHDDGRGGSTRKASPDAEQGSVAAEEMNAQAAPLRGVVGDLESMVAARTAVATAPTAPMDTE